jgi:hypothetical protein
LVLLLEEELKQVEKKLPLKAALKPLLLLLQAERLLLPEVKLYERLYTSYTDNSVSII